MDGIIELSERGKDFRGKELSEDNLHGFQFVLYKSKIYITGNRRNTQTELYDICGNFVMTINNMAIRLVRNKIKLSNDTSPTT